MSYLENLAAMSIVMLLIAVMSVILPIAETNYQTQMNYFEDGQLILQLLENAQNSESPEKFLDSLKSINNLSDTYKLEKENEFLYHFSFSSQTQKEYNFYLFFY